jgi:hypothetical protein
MHQIGGSTNISDLTLVRVRDHQLKNQSQLCPKILWSFSAMGTSPHMILVGTFGPINDMVGMRLA